MEGPPPFLAVFYPVVFSRFFPCSFLSFFCFFPPPFSWPWGIAPRPLDRQDTKKNLPDAAFRDAEILSLWYEFSLENWRGKCCCSFLVRVPPFVDTASGFGSFGGLRLVVVVRLLGTRILVRKFLLFLLYLGCPPGSAFSGLGWSPLSPVGRCP